MYELTKKEKEFLENLVNVSAKIGEAELERLIRYKRDENRLAANASMEQRKQEQEAQEALEKRIKGERIAKYYQAFMGQPSFSIEEANVIEDEPLDTTQHLWSQAFRKFGEFYNSNPFYRLDLEQKLYFIGVTNVRLKAEWGQMDAILPYWFDHKHVTLQDVMDRFVPIEETDPELTFVDAVESIRQELVTLYQQRGQATQDALALID